MGKDSYRERIYNNYVWARNVPLSPTSTKGFLPQVHYIKKIIKNHFPKNLDAKILDLGCGNGVFLYFAKRLGYSCIHGIDGSIEQVEAAHKLGIKEVEKGDLFIVLSNLENSSQDCIITFDVIEHFSREELIPLVDEIYRVLRPSAPWIIHTPNGASPFFGRIRYGDLTHEIAFTSTSIAQLLLSSDFTRVSSYEDEPVPHGIKSAIRWVLWKIIRFFLCFYIAIESGDSSKDTIFSQNFLTVAYK